MHSLIARQIRKAFGRDATLSPELTAFVAAVSDAYDAADTDRRRLEHSLELASSELFERNQQLEARQREMATILDNVAQGFATVSLDGAIGAECSAALLQWFGPVSPERPLWSYLFGDSDVAAWTELGFFSLRNGEMPVDVVLQQLPSRVDRGPHKLRLEYRPIGAPLTAILVVATDISEELARMEADRIHAELIAFMDRMSCDRSGLLEFIRSTDELIARLGEAALPIADLRRVVHTLKGNAGLFGVLTVADACQTLETELLDQDHATPTQLAPLRSAWQAFRDRAQRLIDHTGEDVVVVERAEFRAACADLGAEPPADRIRRWGNDATRPHLERFAQQARSLATQLAKPMLEIAVEDHGVSVERERFAPLWPALVHAVRNAVAHGVETHDERLAHGKSEVAHLALRTAVVDAALVIEIEDDGPGIDWAALRAKARSLGLPEDGGEALFADGVSTAAETNDVAGRGVGMGALRETCAALGGRIELSSFPGRGTAIRCVVPLAG